MKIAIDCGPLFKKNFSPEYDKYIIDAIFRLQKLKPEVDLLFVLDKNHTELPDSLRTANFVTRKKWPGKAGWKIWYDNQIPSVLKKFEADLLLSTGIISRNKLFPQCVWMPETSLEVFKKKKYFEWFRKKMPIVLGQATIIFTDSEKCRQSILAIHRSIENKVIIIPPVPDDDASQLSWEQKDEIKKRYAGGKEYFLVHQNDLPTAKFVALLKAFSQFKKRQQSNMQFVIPGIQNNNKISEKLEGYKYRADVHLIDESGAEIQKISGAAYALIETEKSDRSILNSFVQEVPVVIDKERFRQDAPYFDAALSANFNDTHDLAHQLMLLFKDEKLRGLLVEKGRDIAKKHQKDFQSELLWEGFSRALLVRGNNANEIKSSI